MTVMVVTMTVLVIVAMTLIVKMQRKAKTKAQRLLVIFQINQERHQSQKLELLMSVKTKLMTTAVLVMTVMMTAQIMKTGMQDTREMVLTVNSVSW